MALVAKFLHLGLRGIIGGGKLATIVAIIVAAIVYFILLLMTGSLNYEDVVLLSGGEKVANKLNKMGILKK